MRQRGTCEAKAPLEEIRQLEANGMSASGTYHRLGEGKKRDEMRLCVTVAIRNSCGSPWLPACLLPAYLPASRQDERELDKKTRNTEVLSKFHLASGHVERYDCHTITYDLV